MLLLLADGREQMDTSPSKTSTYILDRLIPFLSQQLLTSLQHATKYEEVPVVYWLLMFESDTSNQDQNLNESVSQSHFFQATAAARTIGHVCQARSEVQDEKGQRVPCKPPGEQELGIVKEARSWHQIPLGADHLRRLAVPLIKRAQTGTYH